MSEIHINMAMLPLSFFLIGAFRNLCFSLLSVCRRLGSFLPVRGFLFDLV